MSTVGRLAGKVAVITGGASGIGLATAHRLVAEGARLVIGDINAGALAAAEAELGAAAAAVRCDVRAEDDVAALLATAEGRFGGVNVAFANAGIGALGLITDSDAADWRRVMEVNLLGPMLTVKHAARRMTDGGSPAGLQPGPRPVRARLPAVPAQPLQRLPVRDHRRRGAHGHPGHGPGRRLLRQGRGALRAHGRTGGR